MALKTVKSIRFNKEMIKRLKKTLFSSFCILFIPSIRYKTKNLLILSIFKPKFDGQFLSYINFFIVSSIFSLLFLYRYSKWPLYQTNRPFFVDKLSVSNLVWYIRRSLHYIIHYTYILNTVFNTTTLFNHSKLLYKVVQGHLISLEH